MNKELLEIIELLEARRFKPENIITIVKLRLCECEKFERHPDFDTGYCYMKKGGKILQAKENIEKDNPYMIRASLKKELKG